MMDVLKDLAKQPFWVIALLLGAALVASACITVDKEYHWSTHPPSTFWLVGVGIVLLLLACIAFAYKLISDRQQSASGLMAGLDVSTVKENGGAYWTAVGSSEIRIQYGRIETYESDAREAIVLPCNEYFDDRCVGDTRTALGAYVNRIFGGRADEFVSLVSDECRKRLGEGVERQKTDDERALSFGPGRCLLLTRPIGHSVSVALVSTTTQRAGQGLASRISYLFDGMRELFAKLADARINEIVMPVLGGGKGGIDPPLALVGLLLAVAEAARYGQGGQRLKRVAIVVFQRDPKDPPSVDPIVVRRALALIGSHR